MLTTIGSNPANGRIPAIVDHTSGGKPKRVFEGAAIQLYLTEKYDKENRISFPYDSDEYWEMVEWMVWMQRYIDPFLLCPQERKEQHPSSSTKAK